MFERLAEAVGVVLLFLEVVVLEVELSSKPEAGPWGKMVGRDWWKGNGSRVSPPMTPSEERWEQWWEQASCPKSSPSTRKINKY